MKKDRHTVLYKIVGASLILSFILRVIYMIKHTLAIPIEHLYGKYSITEFLINYQGGFVRRGLLGEGLYQLRRHFDFEIVPTLMIASLIIYLAITVWFIWKFRKEGYNWWVAMSPLFLNMPTFVVRKDFLMYGLFIFALYCLSREYPDLRRRIGACLIICVALLLHEPIFFWGVPIYVLLLCSYHKDKIVNYTLAGIPIIVTAIIVMAKGSPETVHAINSSWNTVLTDVQLSDHWDNSIGALGWKLDWTLKFHWAMNKGEFSIGRFFTPAILFAAYYMYSNILFVFPNRLTSEKEIRDKKLAISLLYAGTSITLIPLFTVLSCDLPRIYQYGSVAAFAAFLIIPTERILAMYPIWIKKMISRFNGWLERLMPPGKGWMLFLLYFLAGYPTDFMLNWHLTNAGVLFDLILKIRSIYGF